MDNQNLPPDWSACNDAMNSDFSNPNIFWFSNDSILSDGQGYQVIINFFMKVNGINNNIIFSSSLFRTKILNTTKLMIWILVTYKTI